MAITHILFDLDGTIIDSCEGVWGGVKHALKSLNEPIPDTETLKLFIGPPLEYSFHNFCGFDDEKASEAIRLYRNYYGTEGWKQSILYPGVKETLKSLHDKGYKMFIATSKPGVYAEQIADYLEIAPYITAVIGCGLDGTRNTKKEVMQCVLDTYNIPLDQAIMVGDRKFDMIPSGELGLKTVAALFGFGTYEELSSYNPTYYIESFSDLDKLF